MKLIAITGGIGSGKSTVSKIIKGLGYTVFSADEIYSKLILDKSFVKSIYELLDIKTENYVFDKKLVGEKVFSSKELLKKLNDFTHPIIMEKMISLSKETRGIVFNEVPLLFESGFENLYDNIIVVERNLENRVSSVMARDNVTKEEVLLKVKNQVNYENYINNAHTLINNDGNLSELSKKVKEVVSGIIENS